MAREQGMIRTIEGNIGSFAGEAVRKKIIESCGQVTEKSSKKEMAEWVRCAMEKLDALVDEETRVKIMENCGRNCAEVNKRTIERAKARRKKFKTENEFLEAEQQKPMPGTRFERKGNVLYWFFTPHTFRRPMRCFCGLMRGLPVDEQVSRTYCNCSKGFVTRFWEGVLKKPVKIEVLQSALSGAEECKFKIQL